MRRAIAVYTKLVIFMKGYNEKVDRLVTEDRMEEQEIG